MFMTKAYHVFAKAAQGKREPLNKGDTYFVVRCHVNGWDTLILCHKQIPFAVMSETFASVTPALDLLSPAAKRAFNKFKNLEIRVPKNARRYVLPPRFNDED